MGVGDKTSYHTCSQIDTWVHLNKCLLTYQKIAKWGGLVGDSCLRGGREGGGGMHVNVSTVIVGGVSPR